MYKIFICFLIFSSILIQSCNSGSTAKSGKGYVINGYFMGDDDYILMRYDNHVDSSAIVDHKFTFKGFVEYPVITRFLTKDKAISELFFLENSDMEVIFSKKDGYIAFDTIIGNKSHMILSDLIDYYYKTKDDSNFSSLIFNKLDSVFRKNPKNQMCGVVLSDFADGNFLSADEIKKLENALDTFVQDKSVLRSIRNSIMRIEKFNIGDIFENFSFLDKNNKKISIYEKVDSLLLIDFWASWCGPCRESNKELIELFDKYKNKGFDIYSVSVDVDYQDWISASKEDGIIWTNTIAKNGWKNENIIKLMIGAIPANFLIDKNKKIISINIELDKLKELLNSTL